MEVQAGNNLDKDREKDDYSHSDEDCCVGPI